jgi:hypothetical protein
MLSVMWTFYSKTETADLSGSPEFIPSFKWSLCYSIFSVICVFCRSLFVLLFFFFWPLCCLFFFDLLILITPLVSTNSSCPFVLFLLTIVFSVLLRYTDSNYLPLVSSNSSCPFVLFLLTIVFSVLFRFTDSDYLPLVCSNSTFYL